jgi:hypothetical protein
MCRVKGAPQLLNECAPCVTWSPHFMLPAPSAAIIRAIHPVLHQLLAACRWEKGRTDGRRRGGLISGVLPSWEVWEVRGRLITAVIGGHSAIVTPSSSAHLSMVSEAYITERGR